MKKLNIFAVGTVCAMSVSMPLIGSGVAAAADAYAGQTYADASSALKAAGLKGVIASRVGRHGADRSMRGNPFGEGALDACQWEEFWDCHGHGAAFLELQRRCGVGHHAWELGRKPGRQGRSSESELSRGPRPIDCCRQQK